MLQLTRLQILAFRRRAGSLVERLPRSADTLRAAAWAGLQDSMPRAALLSLHARVRGVDAGTLDDPSLVQLWGPRLSTYVVAERDIAIFTLGRGVSARAEQTAARLHALLAGRRLTERELGREAGINPNTFKYGAPTGTIRIRWDGARSPLVWSAEAPRIDPADAASELARRYLHVFGPATVESYAIWAGVRPPAAAKTFEALGHELVRARTPLGEALLLAADEEAIRTRHDADAPARLLPSGDAYSLLQGADRELLVPDPEQRARLWTTRVWPGALLVDGEIRGTWRRATHRVTVEPWGRLSKKQRDAVEAEAAGLPLPGVERAIETAWTA